MHIDSDLLTIVILGILVSADNKKEEKKEEEEEPFMSQWCMYS